jgi:hypothetical protein
MLFVKKFLLENVLLLNVLCLKMFSPFFEVTPPLSRAIFNKARYFNSQEKTQRPKFSDFSPEVR